MCLLSWQIKHMRVIQVFVPLEDLCMGVISLKSQCPKLVFFSLDFLL